jgi:hypothetical protein
VVLVKIAPPSALALASCLLLSLAPRAALAQDPSDIPPSQVEPPAVQGGLDLATKLPFWGSGDPRPFASATLEAGILYYRTTMALGYGKPHWSWVGIEGYGSIAPSGVSDYIGAHASFPIIDARVGVRYSFSTNQYFLRPQDTYTREETEYRLGPRSRYYVLEAELSGSIEGAGGTFFAVATGYAVLGGPRDYFLYEELLHVVMDPPYLFRARAGYLVDFTWEATLKVGGAAEFVAAPGRGALTARAGPVMSVALTHHLDAVGAIMIVLASPDSLGLLGADLGTLGLRYRWATGDPWPELP